MKRLSVAVFVAATLAVPSVQAAPPAADVTITQTFFLGAHKQLPNGYLNLNLHVSRELKPAAGFDPNDLFPLVVDPNAPPSVTPPGVEQTVRISGGISECQYPNCSSLFLNNVTATPGQVTFEDLPLLGNAVTISLSGLGGGSLGAYPMQATLRFARPAQTGLREEVDPYANPWVDGSQAHVDARVFKPLFFRGTYTSVTGSLSGYSGTHTPSSSFGTSDAYLTAGASADVPA